ncbi:sensor histidine kinase [Halobium palmae]|uniref:histidine kinase n=1 Tax=Halobium palmae TaxID=1776492 RepID=A0ABD5S1U7_9EURY
MKNTAVRRRRNEREAARNAWEMVRHEGATLDVSTRAVVDADEGRLRRLFENLFRNAVEHGGSSVTVTVTETPTGFAVEDDGPGFDSDRPERLFDPGVSGNEDGSGFGLYIVRTIAESHGWEVRPGPSPAGGARFEFVLDPVGDADLDIE